MIKSVLFGAMTFVLGSGSFVVGVRPADGQISDGVIRIGVLGNYGSGRDLGGPGSVTIYRKACSGRVQQQRCEQTV
jgi:hypothetical protein